MLSYKEAKESIDSNTKLLDYIKNARNTSDLNVYVYLITGVDDKNKRNYLILKACYFNPLLSAKAVNSVCDNTLQLEEKMLKIIEQGMENSIDTNRSCSMHKMSLFLKAAAELSQYSLFVEYFIMLRSHWRELGKSKKEFLKLEQNVCEFLNFFQYCGIYREFIKEGFENFIEDSFGIFEKLYQKSLEERTELKKLYYIVSEHNYFRYSHWLLELMGEAEPFDFDDESGLRKYAGRAWGTTHWIKEQLGCTMYELNDIDESDMREFIISLTLFQRGIVIAELFKLCRWGLYNESLFSDVIQDIAFTSTVNYDYMQKIKNLKRIKPSYVKKDLEKMRKSFHEWYVNNDLFFDFPYQQERGMIYLHGVNSNYAFAYSLDDIKESGHEEKSERLRTLLYEAFCDYTSVYEILWVFLNSPLRFVFSIEEVVEDIEQFGTFTEKDINDALSQLAFFGEIREYKNATKKVALRNVINYEPIDVIEYEILREMDEMFSNKCYCQIRYQPTIPRLVVSSIEITEEDRRI